MKEKEIDIDSSDASQFTKSQQRVEAKSQQRVNINNSRTVTKWVRIPCFLCAKKRSDICKRCLGSGYLVAARSHRDDI